MTILIYSADLNSENSHLMPWRTVLEVAKQFVELGYATNVYSGTSDAPDEISDFKDMAGVFVVKGPKPFSMKNRTLLRDYIRRQGIEALFFPVAFARDYSRLAEVERHTSCRITWYIPGGWFTVGQSLKAAKHIGLRMVLPYLFQGLMPKKYFLSRLRSGRERSIIAMAEHTAEELRKSGYDPAKIFYAPPGKAPLRKSEEVPHCFNVYSDILKGEKYFLFFGPPSPIRGINQIIQAFYELVRRDQKCKLVCLFRGDSNVDGSVLRRKIGSYAFGDRIICVWSSVNGADLDLFLRNCYAVLKPFLIVPSEIPLAVLETAGYGKPVIGTGPDGTGNFVDKFGLTVPHADSKALAAAMMKMLDDKQLYKEKCDNAAKLYESHPDWHDVAQVWLQAGKIQTI